MTLDRYFVRAGERLPFLPGRIDPLPLLDTGAIARLSHSCRAARRKVAREWAAQDAQLRGVNLAYLEAELGSLWCRHGEGIRAGARGRIRRPRSAAQAYECWPSATWFGEDAPRFQDRLDFEVGDSSYNVWILDRTAVAPVLGRLVCDLYLRSEWPVGERGRLWWEASDAAAFVALAAAGARRAAAAARALQEGADEEDGSAGGDDKEEEEDAQQHLLDHSWEFQMRPVEALMAQIWWESVKLSEGRGAEARKTVLERRPWLSSGPLAPRRPQPTVGLSLLRGQTSVFMTWDRFEVWVYDCYVD